MSRRLIAVLGMHRSDTSLAARGLQALGDDLLAADLIAARGGILGPCSVRSNNSGQGMNQAIELALASGSDLIVFSDDDIEWHPDFLARLVRFWSNAPHDFVLASGFVEPRFKHNAVRGTIDSGGVRALVRETAAGGAWSFPAAHWRWIGPLQPGMEADWEACLRLRSAGFRLAQIDLATHLGEGRSTWGNKLPASEPVHAELLGRLRVPEGQSQTQT